MYLFQIYRTKGSKYMTFQEHFKKIYLNIDSFSKIVLCFVLPVFTWDEWSGQSRRHQWGRYHPCSWWRRLQADSQKQVSVKKSRYLKMPVKHRQHKNNKFCFRSQNLFGNYRQSINIYNQLLKYRYSLKGKCHGISPTHLQHFQYGFGFVEILASKA